MGMRVHVYAAAAGASVREARIKEEQQALADEGVCVCVCVRASVCGYVCAWVCCCCWGICERGSY